MELSKLRTLAETINFDEEYIIGEKFSWKEGKGSIIALTRKGKELSLWMLVAEDEMINHFSDSSANIRKRKDGTLTEREQIIDCEIKDNLINCIREFKIQDKIYQVSSMSAYPVNDIDYEPFLLLIYFMRHGSDYEHLEGIPCDSMELAQFVLEGEYNEIPFDQLRAGQVQIMPCKRKRKVLVGKQFDVTVGEYKDNKLILMDELRNKEHICYINTIGLYDPWSEEELKKFDTAEYKEKFTNKELEQMKEEYYSLMERNCPRGKKFAYVEYEAEDDVMLDFHTREFLNKKVKIESTASVLLFFAQPDKSVGCHGIKLKVCMLETVDQNADKIPIELLWFYIDEEIEGICQ